MLVLSRKKSEAIVIGNDQIEITVVEVRGDRVRLGIEAPEAVPIYRKEVWLQIQDELDVEQVQESIDQANL